MAATLKVLTWNCWGLPFPVICKNRHERMKAIADYLKSHDYDLIILEEIWVKSDYNNLREALKHTHDAHYFFSGTIGSGICVFSKHPIVETSFHRFILNGQAHKFYHGDWFGGKGIGLCRIKVGQLDVNLYCTHFHAEYNHVHDEYHAHRVCQSFELSQYVNATMSGCDMVIVAGDLNTKSTSLSYQIITQNSRLKDCWVLKTNRIADDLGATCDIPGNSYTSNDSLKSLPQGQRIDYILYRGNKNLDMNVTCETGLGIIPGQRFNYSDHEPVMATLTIQEKKENCEKEGDEGMCKELKETLQDSVFALDKGISQCLGEEKFFQLMIILLSVMLYVVSFHMDATTWNGGLFVAAFIGMVKLALAIGVGFSVWESLIVKRAEFHGLIASKEDIKRVLGSGGCSNRGF